MHLTGEEPQVMDWTALVRIFWTVLYIFFTVHEDRNIKSKYLYILKVAHVFGILMDYHILWPKTTDFYYLILP